MRQRRYLTVTKEAVRVEVVCVTQKGESPKWVVRLQKHIGRLITPQRMFFTCASERDAEALAARICASAREYSFDIIEPRF